MTRLIVPAAVLVACMAYFATHNFPPTVLTLDARAKALEAKVAKLEARIAALESCDESP